MDMAVASLIDLAVGTAAPADTSLCWLDVAGAGPQTSSGTLKIYDPDTSAWLQATKESFHRHIGGPRHTSQTAPHAGPRIGDTWYDTAGDALYYRINDGTNDIWIDVSTPGGVVPTAPVAWGV